MARFSSDRRRFLAAGAVLGAAALAVGLRPRDKGGSHSPYFEALGNGLHEAGLARPTLVIDKQRLEQNIDVLMGHLGKDYAYRIVAKSLPSVDLLNLVMQRSGSERLMVFHQPFLNLVAERLPTSDILLGKPMPVAAAARFYQYHRAQAFDPARQLQWLVDSNERLAHYASLARQLGQNLRINLELDVGLHRGGFDDRHELAMALQLIDKDPLLQFAGFMGYEPHVAKMPAILGGADGAFRKAQARYRELLDFAEKLLGRDLSSLVLNAAGSPTYQLYNGEQPANELSVGSALVKPGDFDLPTLQDHQPAAWIATPVIKTGRAMVPGIEALAAVSAALNPNKKKAFFIYGGYWKARPESPSGLATSSLYGRSTNQEMLTGSASIQLAPDDWVFLRPNQSEHVFLQFGDIAVVEGGKVQQTWPVFTQGA